MRLQATHGGAVDAAPTEVALLALAHGITTGEEKEEEECVGACLSSPPERRASTQVAVLP